MSGVRCHMSCVMCHLSLVTCHLLHVTNANSHGASPCYLPQYAQQDAAADLDIHPKIIIFGVAIFDHFGAKIAISLLFPNKQTHRRTSQLLD